MADSRRDGTVKATGRADVHTPVTVLTGFLGSGKTTLLNRVLKDPASAGFIVVINEFGQVSIDHALTATSSDSIVVLENGCLCCTVFGDLLQTLNRLYHAREAAEISFDRIVIETSGLADLTPVVQAFLSDPTLEGLYRLSAVIATVDAVNAIGTLSEHEVSVRQVALADCILVTKLDLLPVSERAATLAALTSRLRGYNRTARICAADDPGVILSQIICQRAPLPEQGSEAAIAWLDSSLRGQELAHGEPAHHHDSSITSFNLIRTDPVPREALQLLLTSLEKHLGPNLLRVKGLVNVAEQPSQPAVIQGAQHLMHNLTWLDQWPDSDHRTRIVFITQGVPANELEELVSLLDRVAHRTANARLRASATARASKA